MKNQRIWYRPIGNKDPPLIRDPIANWQRFGSVNKGPHKNSDFRILSVNKGPPRPARAARKFWHFRVFYSGKTYQRNVLWAREARQKKIALFGVFTVQICLILTLTKVMWIRDPLEFREFSHVNKGPPPNSGSWKKSVNKGPPRTGP